MIQDGDGTRRSAYILKTTDAVHTQNTMLFVGRDLRDGSECILSPILLDVAINLMHRPLMNDPVYFSLSLLLTKGLPNL